MISRDVTRAGIYLRLSFDAKSLKTVILGVFFRTAGSTSTKAAGTNRGSKHLQVFQSVLKDSSGDGHPKYFPSYLLLKYTFTFFLKKTGTASVRAGMFYRLNVCNG